MRNNLTFVSTYPPTLCGIATYTKALYDQLATCSAANSVVAISDRPSDLTYPPEVGFVIVRDNHQSYVQASDYLQATAKVVCVQHEYGIYGGPAGSLILSMLRRITTPIVSTLHTVLRRPTSLQHQVLSELVALSSRTVVMTRHALTLLTDMYGCDPARIEMIHHGAPNLPFADPEDNKRRLGLEGRLLLLTSGFLSPNKGVETVIAALPAIVSKYRHVTYVVAGITHPNVRKRDGESYRIRLHHLVQQLGVGAHVHFWDRYLSSDELTTLFAAADIFIAPFREPEQSSSGTLAYALGAGKAVIATPYAHARELLANGAGLLFPFGDSGKLAEIVIEVIGDPERRLTLSRRAYALGQRMVWSEVARAYTRACEDSTKKPSSSSRLSHTPKRDNLGENVVALDIRHVLRLTDETGIIQHAFGPVPNRVEGYCTDDNARALILAVRLQNRTRATSRRLVRRYLAFLLHAFNPENSRMRNFLSYDRRWLEDMGSEECHGRSILALGVLIAECDDTAILDVAQNLFGRLVPPALSFTSVRAIGFALLGICDWLEVDPASGEFQSARNMLADKLLEAYRRNYSDTWPWFEQELTYLNAALPQALLRAGRSASVVDMCEAALAALDWLVGVQQSPEGNFSPIGNRGFWRRGNEQAHFDQQPVDAHATVAACLEAYRATLDTRWYWEAHRSFSWFLGFNDLGLPLYDRFTGGCRDGLQSDGVNQNQGAESTLAFALASLEMSTCELNREGAAEAQSVSTSRGATDRSGGV